MVEFVVNCREAYSEQAGEAIVAAMVRTANGRLTAAEAFGHREISMTRLFRGPPDPMADHISIGRVVMLRRFLIAALFTGCAAFAPSAAAQTKMIVGFPPGQATELAARVLAEGLTREMGSPVVVVNIPGQGGSIALNALINSPADGSVITVSALAAYAINPHLYSSVRYNSLKDVAPVALVADIPVVLVVNPAVKATNLKELVALAKADPGVLMHSSSGNGTVSHLGMVDLKRRLGIEMTHVPYAGSGRAMTDLMGGRVHVGLDSVAAVKSFIEAG